MIGVCVYCGETHVVERIDGVAGTPCCGPTSWMRVWWWFPVQAWCAVRPTGKPNRNGSACRSYHQSLWRAYRRFKKLHPRTDPSKLHDLALLRVNPRFGVPLPWRLRAEERSYA